MVSCFRITHSGGREHGTTWCATRSRQRAILAAALAAFGKTAAGPCALFCAEQGVSEASFFAWRRTIAERDQQQPTPPQSPATFVPLRVIATPAPQPARPFEVVLNDDRVVRVPAGFDPASLRQLLAILHEERPC